MSININSEIFDHPLFCKSGSESCEFLVQSTGSYNFCNQYLEQIYNDSFQRPLKCRGCLDFVNDDNDLGKEFTF